MMQEKLVAGIKVKNKVMREINNNIYLPFGTDYSIFLKNLNSKKASIDIEIDGEDILDGYSLIVNSLSELELERWLVGGNNKGPKLKFVEKTEEIRKTKDDSIMDGIVKISFRFELSFSFFDKTRYEPLYFISPPSYYGNYPYTTCKSVCDSNNPNIYCSSNITSMTVDVDADVDGTCLFLNEDGMTVKGDESNQQFFASTIGILEPIEHVICFNLKGDVNKPLTVKSKISCSKCNFKNKSSYRFCTQCGNSLIY